MKNKEGTVLLSQLKTVFWCNADNDSKIAIRLCEQSFIMIMTQVCIPIIDIKEQEVDYLYGQFLSETAKTCKQIMLFVFGDWNAKVGNTKERNRVGFYSLEKRNEAGEQLKSFCQSNHFFTTSTVFK